MAVPGNSSTAVGIVVRVLQFVDVVKCVVAEANLVFVLVGFLREGALRCVGGARFRCVAWLGWICGWGRFAVWMCVVWLGWICGGVEVGCLPGCALHCVGGVGFSGSCGLAGFAEVLWVGGSCYCGLSRGSDVDSLEGCGGMRLGRVWRWGWGAARPFGGVMQSGVVAWVK